MSMCVESERTDRLLYIMNDVKVAAAFLDFIVEKFPKPFLYVIPVDESYCEVRTNDNTHAACDVIALMAESFEKGHGCS